MAAIVLMSAPAFLASCDDDPWYDKGPGMMIPGDGGPGDGGRQDGGDGQQGDDGGNESTGAQGEAEVLQGEWDGTMEYFYSDGGETSKFYANMTFVRNSSDAVKGTGTEIDYTLDSLGVVADTQTLKFNWSIDETNGNITIQYLTDNGLTFVMDASATEHGFKINEKDGTFYGYMIGTNTRDMIYIDLRRVTNNTAKQTRAAEARMFGKGTGQHTATGVSRLDGRR